MARVRVKVLMNHTTDRLHSVGEEYLIKPESLAFAVKIGWVEVVPRKNKRK